MLGSRLTWGVLGAALLLLVPVAPAQIDNPDESTQTTLYFHIWDTFNKFVINTQEYNSTFFDAGGVNFPTIQALGEEFNTIYGYSTAGPVEYDFIEAGRPRLHPERGIAQDVLIDPTVDPMVYLYIDARGLQGADDTPALLPQLTFRVTMREGDDPGSDLDAGEMIMEGQATAYMFDGRWCPNEVLNAGQIVTFFCQARYDLIYGGLYVDGAGAVDQTLPVPGIGNGTLPQEAPDGTPILYPDASNVIELAIPMSVLNDGVIPKTDSYNIRIDWYIEEAPLCPPDACAPGQLRLVLDNDHLPRLDMNVLNPVYIEFIHPQVAAGTLLIHTGVNSPWGTYDIDPESIQITIDGPSTPQTLQQVVAQNQHVHNLHDKAAEITYLWDFRDEKAKSGDYDITFEVSNRAGTATAVGKAGFKIEGEKAFGVADTGEVVEQSDLVGNESQGSPATGVLALMAMLGAALITARRRRL